ncbi:hypothetical protein MWU75_15255 [Ornithinimicrobium sp. F0845]|uniref:hypothetical protein n=1 Tax=Ornithinimicrobium sp. F0845 TaxID=2926412 RepID=UPI001FF28CEC|nr:hypothetical protein [Ornithinimicrobium sp. F0845]MCK0113504.1 hypothetical protein [Ornithinimicrobium sp. F0845]
MLPERSTRAPLVVVTTVVLTVGILVMLWPVLTNPIAADDRYWYLNAAGLTDGSYLGVVTQHVTNVPQAADSGRISVAAFIMRSLSMLLVTDLAVWSSTSIVAGQAILKVVLFLLILLTALAFLRVLRYRRSDGSLGRLSWRTVGAVVLMMAALTAAGAQAHHQARNGWTAYAVLTWGAVIVILGSVALIVWLTRLAARRGGWCTVVGVVLAVLLGLFLNISYELYYVAVPLVLVAVLQQPLTGRGGATGDVGVGDEDRLEGEDQTAARARRAKLWVGGAFAVSFLVTFGALQVWIADHCSRNRCYEPAQLELSSRTLTTATRNLLSSIPGTSRTELLSDLTDQGMAHQMPGWMTLTSGLIAVGTAGALLLLVREFGHAAVDLPQRRGETRLLLLAGLVPAAAALGTALIMALSGASHDLVPTIGTPYRSTMVTWTMLAFTAAMVVAALSLRRASLLPTVAAGLIVALLAATSVAANYPALRASHVAEGHVAVAAVHREVVLGDPSARGNERRCDTLREVRETVTRSVRDRLPAAAESFYQHYHGGPYCSEEPSSG